MDERRAIDVFAQGGERKSSKKSEQTKLHVVALSSWFAASSSNDSKMVSGEIQKCRETAEYLPKRQELQLSEWKFLGRLDCTATQSCR